MQNFFLFLDSSLDPIKEIIWYQVKYFLISEDAMYSSLLMRLHADVYLESDTKP
jgi:hypothetical protein